jgi:phosphatidylserine decarboxylase
MKYSEPIAREGLVFILPAFLLAMISWYAGWPVAAVVFLVFALFSMFFFRNPPRSVPAGDDIVVSPADGRIMRIDSVQPDAFISTEMIRISIFLSIFNVHINRVPVAGEVVFLQTGGSSYLPAYRAEAGAKNVRKYLGLRTAWGDILAVQVTGLVARRIVNRAQLNESYALGERYGLIRFGSCTELYLPPNAKVSVREGQKVKGGESILARFIQP